VHAIVFCINFIFMMIQNSHKMFGLRILKLIMYYIKIHYSYGLLHHLFIKIIIRKWQNKAGAESPSVFRLTSQIYCYLVSFFLNTN